MQQFWYLIGALQVVFILLYVHVLYIGKYESWDILSFVFDADQVYLSWLM